MNNQITAEILGDFERAISLVRAKRYDEAMPLLQRTASLEVFPYARMIRNFAQFRIDGHELATVSHADSSVTFRIGGENLGLDMFHVDGRFFEIAELEYCRSRVPHGGTIVDVGANVGNHSVFFGHYLRPRRLIPVEPHPSAVPVLRHNLDLNRIAADERGFGIGVAAHGGRAGIRTVGGDLVVGQLTRGGNIPVVTLDELVDEHVDLLKIDVEGMEIDVLLGARQLISRSRPLILIEVHNLLLEKFKFICNNIDYQIEYEFATETYVNYFLRPVERELRTISRSHADERSGATPPLELTTAHLQPGTG